MDMQRLRRVLKELNPFFWNAEIDSRFQGKTLIESALGRYFNTLSGFESKQDFSSYPKSGPYRQQILTDRNPDKIRFDNLFKEIEKECLVPYDKVYDVLRKEFTSSFAEQILLTNENLIRGFSGVSTEIYKDWVSLVVCMSHENFWADSVKTSVVKQTLPSKDTYKQFLDGARREIEDLAPLSPEIKDIFKQHIDGYIEWHNNNPEEALHINDVPVSENLNLLQNDVKRARTDAEMLLRSYFILAVLYDGFAQSRRRPTIYFDWEYNRQDTIASNFGFCEWDNMKKAGGELNEQIWRDEISDCLRRVKRHLQNNRSLKTTVVKDSPTSQDFTLLDEFERNVETVADILEDGIKTIGKWFEDFKYVKEHNLRFLPKRTTDDVITILKSFYPFGDLLPEIQRYLTHHIPNFKDKVEGQYTDIKNKIEEIIAKCSHAPLNPPARPVAYAEMSELRRYIELLVGDLRHCVKEAKEDVAKGTGQPIKSAETRTNLNQNQANLSGDNLQPDKAFLSRIANSVDGLVIDRAVLKTFQEKIRPFAQRWEQHNSDTENAIKKRNEHWQKVKNNPAWQDKEAGPPQKGWEWDRFYLGDVGFDVGPTYEMPARYAPAVMAKLEDYIKANKQRLDSYNSTTAEYQRLEKTVVEQEQNLADIRTQFNKLPDKNEGWISTAVPLDRPVQGTWIQFLWFRYTDLSDEEVFGCWRPRLEQIQPNPVEALITNKETGMLPPPVNPKQEYERYYVVLTSIHDNMLTGVQGVSDGIWPKELAEHVWFRFTDAQPYGPDKGFIQAALERVQADSASKQKNTGTGAETENKNYIKKGKVWTFHFAGQDVSIPDTYKGLPLIVYLLQNPNKTFSAFELERKVTARPVGKSRSGNEISDVWDNETESPELTLTETGQTINQQELAYADVKSLQSAINELNARKETESEIEKREEIDGQVKALKVELEKKTNRFGRPRPEPGNLYEKARVRVTQKIDRVKKILLKDHKKLYDHLALCLKTGTECSYTLENLPDWQIN
jgi:hypothetical protein